MAIKPSSCVQTTWPVSRKSTATKFDPSIIQIKQPLAIPLMTIRPADAVTQVVHSCTFLVIYKYVHKKNQEQ